MSEAGRERAEAQWQTWQVLPAVRDGRVYLLNNEYLCIPGPRFIQTAEDIADCIDTYRAGTK